MKKGKNTSGAPICYANGQAVLVGDRVVDCAETPHVVIRVVDTLQKAKQEGTDKCGVAIQPAGYKGNNFIFYPDWSVNNELFLIARGDCQQGAAPLPLDPRTGHSEGAR